LNPNWNEQFLIPEDLNQLTIECWDHDTFSDDFMGTAIVPLTEPKLMWLKLLPRNKKDKVSGEVLVQLMFF
jgi:Ca2+-dependent lipid-binding protein